MSLQQYGMHQGYEELIVARQARIRQVIAEERLARQVRASRTLKLGKRTTALLATVRRWPAGAEGYVHAVQRGR